MSLLSLQNYLLKDKYIFNIHKDIYPYVCISKCFYLYIIYIDKHKGFTMALVGIEGLDLSEVVSDDINEETNETVIDITDVEIVSDVISDVTNSSNVINDAVIEVPNIETNNDASIGDTKCNIIDRIDISKIKNRINTAREQFDTDEETIMDYNEFLVKEVITEIDIDEVVETPTKLVIKLNGNETKLSYNDNFVNIERILNKFIHPLNEKEKEYLRNILNNLNRDYYDKLSYNIDTIYIKFDNEYNHVHIKKFIIDNIFDLTDTFSSFVNRGLRR